MTNVSATRETPPTELLESMLALYPFQPATGFWRWFELHALFTTPMPTGLGLDLGCGDGKLTRLVMEHNPGWRLVGVDPDPAEVELARAEGIYERLHCAFGDKIPEADASFDFVFSNSVLEHIPDVQPVLVEARRVLKADGSFVLTVPSAELHDCLRGFPQPWRSIFRESREEYLREFDTRIAHRYYWTDDAWREHLTAAGFRRVEISSYFNEAAVVRFEKIANHTSGVLYKAFGGKQRPIEIQRTLGLRRADQKLPPWGAAAIAKVLCAGYASAEAPRRYGCRLIKAYA